MSVAAGNSPFSTGLIGKTSLDPVWATLVGAVSLGDPDRVLVIYPFLSALVLVALMLVLYLHFLPPSPHGAREEASPSESHSYWRKDMCALLVVFFVALLATPPLGFLGPYRAYWAKMFLLKPNHALGFILIPVLIGWLTKTSRSSTLVSGILLGLLGWTFIIHWAFACFSLLVYWVLKVFFLRVELGGETRRMVVVVLISMAIVAPWFYQISSKVPPAFPVEQGLVLGEPAPNKWFDSPPRGQALLLLVTLDLGVLFYLGMIGLAGWLQKKGRKELLWASLLLGAYGLWLISCLLYTSGRARETDEFYYFLVFVLSVAAGHGAFSVLKFVQSLFDGSNRRTAGAVMAALVVAFVPISFPNWWSPPAMDVHFRVALEPLPREITELGEWIRDQTRGEDVFVVEGYYSVWIPALTGRQTLRAKGEENRELIRGILTGDVRGEDEYGIEPHGITHVVWDRFLAQKLGLDHRAFVLPNSFELVHQVGGSRVYRVVPAKEDSPSGP
jgi:hypothetical protein